MTRYSCKYCKFCKDSRCTAPGITKFTDIPSDPKCYIVRIFDNKNLSECKWFKRRKKRLTPWRFLKYVFRKFYNYVQ